MPEPLKPEPMRPPGVKPPVSWGAGLGYGGVGVGTLLVYAIFRALHVFHFLGPAPIEEPPLVPLTFTPVPARPPAVGSIPPALARDCHDDVVVLPVDKLRQCADAGFSRAQNLLGAAYLKGNGLPQDYTQAAALFRAASDQGQTEARRNLAALERQGLGTPKDPAAARLLYAKGAQLGDPIAQDLLGMMMIDGDGGPADAAGGFASVRRAALDTNLPAMADLGKLYAQGSGTPRDLAKAAAWRKAAAEAGNTDAMQAYGLMLLDGTPPNLPEAYRWLSLAARKAPQDPRLARLPRQQRAEIDAQVAAWHPSPAALPSPKDQ